MKMINQDTICAIATAQGGAIGIIRVSGPKAIEITSRIYTPATGKPLTERAPYTLTFGKRFVPQSEKLIIHFSNKRVKFRKKKVKRYKNFVNYFFCRRSN